MKTEFFEIVEVKPWLFKVRSATEKRKWYEVIWRRDKTFFCNCKNFRYNSGFDKHIEAVKALVK